METTRRSFIVSSLVGLVGASLPGVPINPTPFSYSPHPAQLKFLSQVEPLSLYGIPYHLSDASAGSWLGFNRIIGVSKDWEGFPK